jgi:hypothetical protein
VEGIDTDRGKFQGQRARSRPSSGGGGRKHYPLSSPSPLRQDYVMIASE